MLCLGFLLASAGLTGSRAQGIGTLRLLRQMEERTGRGIADLFDLICGTSTGGILATALALKSLTLDDCEDIYRQAAVSRVTIGHDASEHWIGMSQSLRLHTCRLGAHKHMQQLSTTCRLLQPLGCMLW